MSDANAGSIRAKLILENSDFKKKMQDSRNEMEKSASKAQSFKKSLDVIQKGSTITASAVAGVAVASTKLAADFEGSMARVQAVTNSSASDMQLLEAAALEAGRTTTYSSTEAASALELLGMSGMNAQEMIAALPNVLNAAAAGQISLSEAADLTTNVMSAFGLSAEETGRAVDVLTATATSSNSTLSELAGGFKMVGPVAAAAGLSIEEVSAVLGVLHDSGIKSTESGTATRAMLLSLLSPAGEGAKRIKELGIEVTNADGAMKPLPELISHIAEKMDGMSESQKTATASQLVGREAASALLSLLEAGGDTLADYTSELENSAGVAERVASVQNNTVNGAFKEFQSALEGVGISIGNEYLPYVRTMIETGTDLVRQFGEINPEIIAAGINFIGASAGIALATSTAIKLASALRGLMMLSPSGWLILGLSLLGGAIFAATMESQKMAEVNLDVTKSLHDQSVELEDAANGFEELRNKARLTNDQLGEILDLRQKMGETGDVEELEKLQGRYDELRKKSGLTNDELDRLIGLNDIIIEKAPHLADAYSEGGNAIAGVNDRLREYVGLLRESALEELELERIKWAAQKEQHQQDLNEAMREEERISLRLDELRKYEDMDRKDLRDLQHEILEKLRDQTLSAEEMVELTSEERLIRGLLDDGIVETIDNLKSQREEQRGIIENAETELAKGEEIDSVYSEILLRNLDINTAGQEGIDLADQQLSKLKEEKAAVQERIAQEGDKNGLLTEQLGYLNESIGQHETILGQLSKETDYTSELVTNTERYERQAKHVTDALNAQESQLQSNNSRIDEGTGKAKEMNSELEKDVTKEVKADDMGSVADIDRRASAPVRKRISLFEEPIVNESPEIKKATQLLFNELKEAFQCR